MAGSAAALMNLSINHPHTGENKLIERMLIIPEYRERYRGHLEKLAAEFRSGKIQSHVNALAAILRPALSGDPMVLLEQFEASLSRSMTIALTLNPSPPGEGNQAPVPRNRSPFRRVSRPNIGPPLPDWLVGRAESITEQLEGKREGELPQLGPMLMGPGGPEDIGPGLLIAPEMFADADANGDLKITPQEFQKLAREWFARFDTKKRGSLTVDELASGLNDVLRPSAGLGERRLTPPPEAPGFGAGRSPRTFGPGTLLAPALFHAADADRNGELSAEELVRAFESWYRQWKSGPSGALTEEQLTRGLNRLLTAP
jgi:hypothetical protein